MKEVKAYQCDGCRSIFKSKKPIRSCKECGEEICDMCASFDDDICDDCYEETLEDEDDDNTIPDCLWQDMVRCNPDLAE